MNRRPQATTAGHPANLPQLLELLAQRHRALCCEWQLCTLQIGVDDDLLPARPRLEDALVEVALAMERVETGCYGRCIGCAGPIDFQRLLAHPAATRCWPCQQSAEQGDSDALTH